MEALTLEHKLSLVTGMVWMIDVDMLRTYLHSYLHLSLACLSAPCLVKFVA